MHGGLSQLPAVRWSEVQSQRLQQCGEPRVGPKSGACVLVHNTEERQIADSLLHGSVVCSKGLVQLTHCPQHVCLEHGRHVTMARELSELLQNLSRLGVHS